MRVYVTIPDDQFQGVILAATAKGLALKTFARMAVLDATRAVQAQVLSDWALQRQIVIELIRKGFSSVENISVASGLRRETVKAQLACLEADGVVEERRQPSAYQTVSSKRGTALYFLVGE